MAKEKFVTSENTIVRLLVQSLVRNGPPEHFLRWSIFSFVIEVGLSLRIGGKIYYT